MEYIFPIFAVAMGGTYILGTFKKWESFINPKKSSANPFEMGNYFILNLVGPETLAIYNYFFGAVFILVGLGSLFLI